MKITDVGDLSYRKYSCKDFLFQYLNGFVNLYITYLSQIPSHHVRNFLYRYVCKMKISKNVVIYAGMHIREPYKISIGKGSVLGDCCSLDGRNGISIGDNVNFSSNVSIWTEQHDHRDPYFRCETQPKTGVVIEDYVWIGPNVIILPNVTIGRGAVIGAGAVVTKDIAPYGIAVGIPAKIVGTRNSNLLYDLGKELYRPFL